MLVKNMDRCIAVSLAFVMLAGAGTAAEPAMKPVVIPKATQFELRSKGGRDYRIYVAAPTGKAPQDGFPVIYLTDGNTNFAVVQSAVQRLTLTDLSAVVVGIGYPTDDLQEFYRLRAFDLTPPTSPEWLKKVMPSVSANMTGGQNQFLSFIEDELKPLIEKNYSINRKRQTLFGHSFGGLFALHVLFTQPQSFQTYLACSPSIWWNDRSILAEEKAFVQQFRETGLNARLAITVGEWEQTPGPGVSPERAETLRFRRHVDNSRDLATRLQTDGPKGLTVLFRLFAEEDHGSVVLPAASRGIRFALSESP